jgi:hypothetical protein
LHSDFSFELWGELIERAPLPVRCELGDNPSYQERVRLLDADKENGVGQNALESTDDQRRHPNVFGIALAA